MFLRRQRVPLQAWNCCPPGNQEVPEKHRASDKEVALPSRGESCFVHIELFSPSLIPLNGF